MTGQNVLITGATSRIGEVTATQLALLGAHVIITGREISRCQATVNRITNQIPGVTIDYLTADLSDMGQVKQLAEQFQDKYDGLDILIDNAGAIFLRRHISRQGYERTFATNHLSYFLLSNLLLPTLEKTAAKTGLGRIINVSSEAHRNAIINFNDLQSLRQYRWMRVYGMTKLANLLFTFELDRRIKGRGVTVNALHPGLVRTFIGVNHNPLTRILYRLVIHPFAIPTEEGAQTSIYLASSPEVNQVSGAYFIKCNPVRASQSAYDPQIARRLWDMSSELVKL